MPSKQVIFRAHALRRMFERRINPDAVKAVLQTGETIEAYPDDAPYPSRLVLGWAGNRPLHVVVADHEAGNAWIVITVYEPDRSLWEDGFRRRRR